MNDKQQEMWDLLCELNSETALKLLTDWHGLQLLDDGFYGHLIGEGYIEETPVEDDEFEMDDFTDFCTSFPGCTGCPLEHIGGDCEELYEEMKKFEEEITDDE